MREKIEWYIDQLEGRDGEEPQDNSPMIFEGPTEELNALAKAIPEHPKEYDYLEDRWETLIS